MEDNTFQKDQDPYQGNYIPYYEYSSLQQQQPVLSPQAQAYPPPPQPPFPPAPYQAPPPPKRRRNNALIFGIAAISVVLIVAIIAVSIFSQQLFHPTTVKTTGTAVPTLAPTQQQGTSIPTPTKAFQSAPCPFQLGDGMVDGQTVKCGYVTVPENRSNPNGATIKLAIAIFKSPAVQNDPYPVIRLEGGPGGPSLDNWAHYITSSNESSFVFNHDLIMFDQRGTGYSTPSLKCPEILQLQYDTLNQHYNATDSERLQIQAVTTCYNRLVKAGIDLNSYNSIENAADVHDIIVALGYKQANLYGVSYGTRLALTTMRLFPSVIHSVVLDSVYPPQRNRTDLPSDAQRVFNVLFQGCAADSHCNSSYPQLDSVFYQLVTDLNANPVHFQTTDSTSGKDYTVAMAGDDFVFVLFSALYVTQFISALPQMIYQVRNHDYTLVSRIYGIVEFDNTFSDGMFYSDECSEDWAFLTQNDIVPALQGIAPQIQSALRGDLQQEYDTCQIWKVQKAPAAQKQAVVSNIPTIVLSDEYDPITPPSNGKLAAQTLSNSYYFLFPGLGHGAEYNSPCVDSIISSFDDNPTQKPSDSCIASMGEPAFI